MKGAGILRLAVVASMYCAGLWSLQSTGLLADFERILSSEPRALLISLPLLVAAIYGLIGSIRGRGLRLAYIFSLLLCLPAVLAHSATRLGFPERGPTPPFAQTLLIGLFIQSGYLLLLATNLAEKTHDELVSRGADEQTAGGIFWRQLGLGATLALLSGLVPLAAYLSSVTFGPLIGSVVKGLPSPALTVSIGCSLLILACILYYLLSVSEPVHPSPSEKTEEELRKLE